MDVWLTTNDEGSADLQALNEALREDNRALYGDPKRAVFGVCVRSGADPGELLGGAKGIVHWNWFYLTHLWVREDCRGRGLGQEILNRLVAEGKMKKFSGIYVDTFSQDAVRFYERAGFEVVGAIPRFVNGFDRTYLKINLAGVDTSR